MKIKTICDECGSDMPIDKEKSTENWTVYLMSCGCGGKGTVSINNEREDEK